MRTLKLNVGVVIVAHPHHTKQAAGKARKPRIVAGAGFARSRRDESHVANAGASSAEISSSNLAGIAPVTSENSFHHGCGEEGSAWIEHLPRRGRVVFDDVAGRCAHAGQHPRVDVHAAIGKGRIRAGHVERRGVIGANGH